MSRSRRFAYRQAKKKRMKKFARYFDQQLPRVDREMTLENKRNDKTNSEHAQLNSQLDTKQNEKKIAKYKKVTLRESRASAVSSPPFLPARLSDVIEMFSTATITSHYYCRHQLCSSLLTPHISRSRYLLLTHYRTTPSLTRSYCSTLVATTSREITTATFAGVSKRCAKD